MKTVKVQILSAHGHNVHTYMMARLLRRMLRKLPRGCSLVKKPDKIRKWTPYGEKPREAILFLFKCSDFAALARVADVWFGGVRVKSLFVSHCIWSDDGQSCIALVNASRMGLVEEEDVRGLVLAGYKGVLTEDILRYVLK